MKKTWKGYLTKYGLREAKNPQEVSEATFLHFIIWKETEGGSTIPCTVTIETNRKRRPVKARTKEKRKAR